MVTKSALMTTDLLSKFYIGSDFVHWTVANLQRQFQFSNLCLCSFWKKINFCAELWFSAPMHILEKILQSWNQVWKRMIIWLTFNLTWSIISSVQISVHLSGKKVRIRVLILNYNFPLLKVPLSITPKRIGIIISPTLHKLQNHKGLSRLEPKAFFSGPFLKLPYCRNTVW